jgi:hypothetical protein
MTRTVEEALRHPEFGALDDGWAEALSAGLMIQIAHHLDTPDTAAAEAFLAGALQEAANVGAEAALASSPPPAAPARDDRGAEDSGEWRHPARPYTVRICDQCMRLEGEMCHNPACVFCRRTMREVGEYLDALLLRPVVDGERMPLPLASSSGEATALREAVVGLLDDVERYGWDRIPESRIDEVRALAASPSQPEKE